MTTLNTERRRWDYAVDRLLNSRFIPLEVSDAIFKFVDGDIDLEQFTEVMS